MSRVFLLNTLDRWGVRMMPSLCSPQMLPPYFTAVAKNSSAILSTRAGVDLFVKSRRG